MAAAARGFPVSEFTQRLSRAQKLMSKAKLDALFLTTEPEIRYFTGFLTRFWESPTRPWMLLLPQQGMPIAIIPQIGAHLMAQTWIKDIRTWPAPDEEDDGISLAAETIAEILPCNARIGVPSGLETHLRLPLASWNALTNKLPKVRFRDDAGCLSTLRGIKSDAEIAKIKTACNIAGRAFSRVEEIVHPEAALSQIFRKFQCLCLEEGADWVGYLAGAAGQGGYGDVISPSTDDPIQSGDVLMLDTGAVHDGYFCDFDRNFLIAQPSAAASDAYACLTAASDAAFSAARGGRTFSDLFHVMDKALNWNDFQNPGGRLGHGLGMQLTEGPSVLPDDHTMLLPGMVLTLEPCVKLPNGKIMVHEENIVITEQGAEYLSPPAPRSLPVLGATQ